MKQRKTNSRYHNGQNKDIMYTLIFTVHLCLQLFYYSNIWLSLRHSCQGKLSHVNVWSEILLHIALELNINILHYCVLYCDCTILKFLRQTFQLFQMDIENEWLKIVLFSRCKETLPLYGLNGSQHGRSNTEILKNCKRNNGDPLWENQDGSSLNASGFQLSGICKKKRRKEMFNMQLTPAQWSGGVGPEVEPLCGWVARQGKLKINTLIN